MKLLIMQKHVKDIVWITTGLVVVGLGIGLAIAYLIN